MSAAAAAANVSEYAPTAADRRAAEAAADGASGAGVEASIVVLGHVDAGKSTLVGHLLAQTGAVSARDVDKLRHQASKSGQGASAFAWIMDATEGERGRGVTADVAMTHFDAAPGVRCALLDAPGHRDFVPNMIAGAAQADVAVLVVDASPQAFERGFERGGQTREHAALARALGVSRCVVAVNKMDRAGWDCARFDAIRQQLAPYLASVGFGAKACAWVPLSGLAGDNLTRPPESAEAAAALERWCVPTRARLLLRCAFARSVHARDNRAPSPGMLSVSDASRPPPPTTTLGTCLWPLQEQRGGHAHGSARVGRACRCLGAHARRCAPAAAIAGGSCRGQE